MVADGRGELEVKISDMIDFRNGCTGQKRG